MTDDDFLAAFETCTLARTQWTHEAHVRVAWLYLTRLPFAGALERVRRGIQRLNPTIGSPNGYHETITVASMRLIAHRLRLGDDFLGFRERNADLLDRTLTPLLRHYTKERLRSPDARLRFLEPDLEALPG
jgi:hypothetical protein